MYILYVINIDENAISETEAIIRQYDFLKSDNSAVTALCATIEEEIAAHGRSRAGRIRKKPPEPFTLILNADLYRRR